MATLRQGPQTETVMTTPLITFTPTGGLANRMRATAAAVALARRHDCRLRIVWHRDAGLNCAFARLFLPIGLPDVQLDEARPLDRFLCDRPRRGNFHLSALPLRLRYDGILLDADHAEAFSRQSFPFDTWMRGKRRPFIASCYEFCPADDTLFRQLFVPSAEVQDRMRRNTARFTTHTVGIHIRRTDNVMSIAHSPLSLFVRAMEEEIQAHPDARFFVASDSETDKAELADRFGDRILTSAAPADRNSTEGMLEGAADFFTLGQTCRVIGSFYSSFSVIAARMHGIPYTCMKAD